MFLELRDKLEAAGFEGLDVVQSKWDEDYKHRGIISGVLKDPALGAKRLMSMPDRVTNTIQMKGGGAATRPTVINCYRGDDLGSVDGWWRRWLSVRGRCWRRWLRGRRSSAKCVHLFLAGFQNSSNLHHLVFHFDQFVLTCICDGSYLDHLILKLDHVLLVSSGCSLRKRELRF